MGTAGKKRPKTTIGYRSFERAARLYSASLAINPYYDPTPTMTITPRRTRNHRGKIYT